MIDVGGLALPGISYDSVPPVIADGRAPRTSGEIALDGRTMRGEDWSVGDRVDVREDDGPVRTMTITGRVIAPRIPFQPSENPEQGAFLTIDAMRTVDPNAGYEALYIRFKPGVDQQKAVLSIRQRSAGSAFAVFGRNESATIRNIERISQIPVVLALLVAILGVSTLVHALVSTTRRRRRDIAVLRTIGFVRRQVRATVLWQAATLIGLALAVGVPVGISAGRLGWRLFAEQIDILPAQGSPWLVTTAVAAGALVIGEAAALFPSRTAARTKPAQILRTE